MDSVALQGCTDHDKVVIGDTVCEHILVVSVNDDVDRVVFIVCFLQVLNEGIVRLEAGLLRLLSIQVDDVAFDKLSEVFDLLSIIHHLLVHLLLHAVVHHARLLINFYHLVWAVSIFEFIYIFITALNKLF